VSLVARHAALTDIGRQRQTNEDSLLAAPPLFAVADGMGGARAGEVASRLAIEALDELVRTEAPDAEDAAASLAEAAAEANRRIYAAAGSERALRGMGTTLTALLLRDDRGHLAHVGDSRAYLLREGALTQLTDDHSLVAEMVREGKLTADAAASHPMRSILSRALGTEPDTEVDLLETHLRAGDVLLLCSDGLSGPVPEEKLRKALAGGDPQRAVRRLIDEALRLGGPDNITAVVVRLEAGEGPADASNGKTQVADEPAVTQDPPDSDAAPAEAPGAVAEDDLAAPQADQAGADGSGARRRWWRWAVSRGSAESPA